MLDDKILGRFVEKNCIPYYKQVFRTLIEAQGLGASPISAINSQTLNKVALQSNAKIPWRQRLPFVTGTIWNWPAFFFGELWGPYRGVAYKWAIVAGWSLFTLFAYLVLPSYLTVLASIAVGISFAQYGNSFFLSGILKELQTGTIRKQPQSWRDFGIAAGAIVAVLLVEVLLPVPM